LQQQILLNPNGLEINTSNRFGNVDALGNVSSINSISHPYFGTELTQGTLSLQPKFIPNHFGAGLNSLQFDGINDVINKINNLFKPNWDIPSFFAAKFTYQLDGNNFRQCLYYRSEVVSGQKAFQVSIRDTGADVNKLEVWMSAYHTASATYKRKIVRFDDALVDGSDYIIIFQNLGTDNANDWVMKINGVVSSKTILLNNSFVDSISYPNRGFSFIKFGWNEAAGNFFKGYLGKALDSIGIANEELITNALNSAI